MKKIMALTIVLTFVLAAVSCGKDSPEGGSVLKDAGFKVSVPTFDTKVKQGEVQSVTVSLERGDAFKQDVTLEIKTLKIKLSKGEGFKIAVPTFDTKIKQGEVQSVIISLERDNAFKQDVTLEIKLSKGEGITFDPAKILIKAGDNPNVPLGITVPKNTALGGYEVMVTGTPATGEATSIGFDVNVITPDAGYTMKSDSPKGGSVLKGEGFKIAVPTFDTKINQGEVQSVVVSLERGDAFKQDVTLEITLSKGEGLTFDPAKILVKAGDKPDVQLMITVPKDAALGEYKINVTATPATGEATSAEFDVKVVAPDAGYTMKSDSPKGGSILKGEGITFDPAKVLIKASEKPDMPLRIMVPKNATLGKYKVYVTATPTTGEATMVTFNVKVVTP